MKSFLAGFVSRVSDKFAVEALLVPLFGQFRSEILGSSRVYSVIGGSHPRWVRQLMEVVRA
jgi:hypothetical protein